MPSCQQERKIEMTTGNDTSFHRIDYRLKNPWNQPMIPFHGQQSINSFENVNDKHGHQVIVGSPK